MSETRTRLVETARRLFAERGYGATSLADLRSAGKVHSGSFYHAFPAKLDLLKAVLAHYRDHIDERLIDPAWAGVTDPFERVFALLARYRAWLVESACTFGCPIGSLALELHDPDDDVRMLLAANFEAWTDRVAACFEAARDRLPPDAEPRALALFTLTTMEGAVMLARTHRDLKYFDSAVATLLDHVERLQREAETLSPKA